MAVQQPIDFDFFARIRECRITEIDGGMRIDSTTAKRGCSTMRRWRFQTIVAIGVAILATSCASRPDIEMAPLAEESVEKLRKALIGSWTHRATETSDGSRSSIDGKEVVWTFREDDSGTLLRREGADSSEETWEFQWRLEGRNLFLELDGRRDSYYRVDSWSPRQMRWHDYRTDRTLLLEREPTQER